MLEVTDEMVDLALDVFHDDGMAAALAAVLAIVERDYQLTERCREELIPGVRCVLLSPGGEHRGQHEGKMPTGNTVRWS